MMHDISRMNELTAHVLVRTDVSGVSKTNKIAAVICK